MPVPLSAFSRWTALCFFLWVLVASTGAQDWRNIETGLEIPTEGYADMPLVVTLNDGSWLCTLTTGPGKEGAPGQSIIATRSTDHGTTWSKPVPIAPRIPKHGFESSWVVPLHVATQGSSEFGRVYAFYVTNGDHITEVPGLEDRDDDRVDMLGWYVYRYSDDAGRTWSEPIRIEIPLTQADLLNTFAGRVQMFWGVDEPAVDGSRVLISFSKIRTYLISETEGWVLESMNLLTESDPTLHVWRLLQMGNTGPTEAWKGLHSDALGDSQQEHDITLLADPCNLVICSRTNSGVVAISYSSDGGNTWSEPEPARFTDGGPIHSPLANARLWRCINGKYLLWFHNNMGNLAGMQRYENRNPGWLSGGIERDGKILWSQPEIALYHTDPGVRISYPDLIDESGLYWITETDKDTARAHEIDATLLEGLWAQLDDRADPPADTITATTEIDFRKSEGFSIALAFRNYDLATLSTLASAGDEQTGWTIRAVRGPSLEVELRSKGQTYAWQSDRVPSVAGKTHHAVVTFDPGPAIVTMTINGKLHDGAGIRQFGWGRFPPDFPPITLNPSQSNDIKIFARALRTSEAVELYEAFREALPSTSRTR